MDKLKYKDYVWPQNPATYEEKLSRTPIILTQEDGRKYYGGMGELVRVITGTGTFFGPDAYQQYLLLEDQFSWSSSGDLVHPLLGSRKCFFTALEMTQEPRTDVVSYKFTFTCANAKDEIPI